MKIWRLQPERKSWVEGNRLSIGERLLEITSYGETMECHWRKIAQNSYRMGGYCKRFRRQFSGGKQRRPPTQVSLIQHSLREIVWRTNDANEKPSRESVWIALRRRPRWWISADSLSLLFEFKVSSRNGILTAIRKNGDNQNPVPLWVKHKRVTSQETMHTCSFTEACTSECT